MMRLAPAPHPLFNRDADDIWRHICDYSGDIAAADRRIDELDALLDDIILNPLSGTRLRGRLEGCLVRHGGRDGRLTVVFRPLPDREILQLLMAAFGGRDWLGEAATRL